MEGFTNLDLVRFQAEPPADPPADQKKADPASNWTQEQQDEFNKRAAALKKSAKAEAEAEFQKKQDEAKAEVEKQRLLDEGKFKELATTAEKERDEARKEAEQYKQEKRSLKIESEFDKAISRSKLVFVNDQAREDAFKKVDQSKVSDESLVKDIDEIVKEINKNNSYYFGEIEVPETDATKRGKRPSKEQTDKEREAELKKIYPSANRKPN